MDEAKARALADKLTGAVTVDLYLHDDAEPHIEIVGAEEMILAFAAEVRGDERERALIAVLSLTADDTAKYGGRQAAIDAFDTICKSGLFTSAGGWQLTDLGKAALKRAEAP